MMNSVVDLQDLTCTLCFQQFDEATRCPRVIPTCGHTICEACIQRNLIQSQQTFRCPEDREIVVCSRDSVEQFTKNLSVLKAVQHNNQKLGYSRTQYEETTTTRPSVYPEVMLDVMKLKMQLQLQQDPQKEYQEEMIMIPKTSMVMPPVRVTLVCELHHKIMDLGCITCQDKICSHCAIFGNHKTHTVVPEDEVKHKNREGMEEMKVIQESIEGTRKGFIKKMEDNFQFNICSSITAKKQEFLHSNRIKHEEYQKMLVHAEQRSAESIEKFFGEIEDKFRKFKNHNFSETYEKIHSLNKMVGDMEYSSEQLAEKAELNFDLYLNLDKLMATAKDIELEFNNLLDFPLKLIANYLNNLSISFIDCSSVANAFVNAMTLAFTLPESEVIQKSIQHLTLSNQREILTNSPFDQQLLETLSSDEINQILNVDAPLTPSQAFFNQQAEIQKKQKYSIVPAQLNPLQQTGKRTASSSQESRKSGGQKPITSLRSIRESTNSNNTDQSNGILSGISTTRQQQQQQFIQKQGRERSVGSVKDSMLLSHLDTEEEFLRNTQFNGSFFQSVIVPDPIVTAFQNRQPITSSIIGSRQIEQSSAIKQMDLNSNTPASSILSKSQRGMTGEISSISYNSSSMTPSKQESQSSFPISPKLQSNSSKLKQISSSRYNQTSPISSRTPNKTPSRSISPITHSQKAQTISYLKQQQQEKAEIEQSNLSKSNGMKQSSSQKSHTLKFFKPQQSQQQQQQQQPNSSQKIEKSSVAVSSVISSNSSTHLRKSAATVNFKKKSEKFQDAIQRLRTHQYIDVLDLVGEDINDAEAEEIANELERSHSNLESIKLVKNKIGNAGLKAILEGLKLGGHNIHTLNLTNNICTEYCFFDLLQYLEVNPNLKNIYLHNNNIQVSRNRDHFKSLQQTCNLHIV